MASLARIVGRNCSDGSEVEYVEGGPIWRSSRKKKRIGLLFSIDKKNSVTGWTSGMDEEEEDDKWDEWLVSTTSLFGFGYRKVEPW